jgi:hypothetical protein
MWHIGGTEFIYGECHRIEYPARVILVGSYAFLVGNAILGSVDKILTGTNDANDRKDTEAHKKISVAVLVAKTAVKAYCYALGNVATATANTAGRTYRLLINARRKNDRIYHLDHRLGKILDSARGLGGIAEVVGSARASEHAHVALTAVKDHLLFNDRYPLKFLCSARADAGLKQELDVKSYGHGIKSAIKTNGVDVNVGPGYIRLLCAHVARSLNNIVTDIGKIDPNVLEAIAVTT